MKEKIKKIITNPYLIIFVITLLIMSPLLFSKNYIAGNDTEFHISNVHSIYKNIIQGNISKILPVIAQNFGYGTGIFYPRLAHMSAAIFTIFLGGNVVLSLKAIHFIVYFLSGIMMYKLVNRIFKNKYSAIVSSIFYLTFPYSITEVFVRDAFAESFVFIFIPMIILALYELFYGNRKMFYIWFILGYVGIINSHLVLAVYFTALIFIYLLLNIKKVFNKENLKALIISSILILLLTASFIVPLLQHKALGIYTVFEGDSMSNRGTIVNSTMGFKDFLKQIPSEEFSLITYYLNILGVILAGLAIIFNKRLIKDHKEKNFFKFLVAVTLIILFLMSKLCPWIILPKLMVMIQFAWRLETVLVLVLSILAGLALREFVSKEAKIIMLIIILIFNGYTVYKAYNFDMIKEMDINNIDISFRGMGWEREYLPIATQENLKYFIHKKQEISVKEGEADISIPENSTPNLKALIENCTTETTIELPRIYYLGYDAEIINEDGDKVELELYMNDKGFIETKINSNGTLILKYTGTTANKVANIISIVTLVGIGIYISIQYNKNKKYSN